MNSHNLPENLTSKQRQAIAALLTSRTVVEAAQAAHVGSRTLYRWMTLPAFRMALLEAEGEAISAATRRLIGLQDSAINALECTLTDNTAGYGLMLRAAQTVLDYLLKLRELRNIESRLAELERKVFAG